MTETEKMLAGKIYDPSDKSLTARRARAHSLSRQYNETDETEEEKRKLILDELLPNRGEGAYLQGPLNFDYGLYFKTGRNFCYDFRGKWSGKWADKKYNSKSNSTAWRYLS